jgi:hypothetical protein
LATPIQLTLIAGRFGMKRLAVKFGGSKIFCPVRPFVSFFRENEARHGDATLGRWHLPEFSRQPGYA